VKPAWRAILDEAVDLFLPRRCACCGRSGAWLCAACTDGLHFLSGPACALCGCPGPRRQEECPECSGRDMRFVAAGAAFVYDDAARRLVTVCKFRALRSVAAEMARRAAPAFASLLGRATGPVLVTCVPGHRDHRLERGFNQAEVLARELAGGAGLPFAQLLLRTRHGRRQSELSRAERLVNVRGAFAAREEAGRVAQKLKRVVIVDDVYTTGETLNQCAGALAQVGCEPLAFTFARTVRAPVTLGPTRSAKERRR
jgi:ComF family protein